MQVYKVGVVLITMLTFLPPGIKAQTEAATICGVVTDSESGKGVAGINVYLANTTIGTSTDQGGAYELKTTAPGTYKLVYSSVGYHRKVFSVRLDPGSKISHNVQLEPQIIEMEEVRVVSSNKEWKKDYELFAREFLGETEFAELTTIENPWVLDFEEGEHNTLIASAAEPLVVRNRALGYRLHIELVEFRWSKKGLGGAYQIYPKYEELKADNKVQKKIWLINRGTNYFGSLPHFLKSLYANRVKENHFSVRPSGNIILLSEGEKRFELLGKTNARKREELKGFKVIRNTEISYNNTVTLHLGNSIAEISIRRNTRIEPNMKKKMIFLDKNGNLLNPTSIKLYGDWAKNRIANTLPDNYSPGNL